MTAVGERDAERAGRRGVRDGDVRGHGHRVRRDAAAAAGEPARIESGSAREEREEVVHGEACRADDRAERAPVERLVVRHRDGRPARTAEADVTPPSPALGVAEALQGADALQARDNG